MKRKLLLAGCVILCLDSCSSNKKTTETNNLPPSPKNYTFSNDTNTQSESAEITHKVNRIIEKYAKIPITSIARSKISETNFGYEWKFVNVKTGEKFIVNTGPNLEVVTLFKKTKKW